MYLFITDDDEVYGYTKDKKIAKDFYSINEWRFKMIKVGKHDLNTSILNAGGDIDYYDLIDEDGHEYKIPLTENEAGEIINKCIHMTARFVYANHELCNQNKYGLKSKYLNIINDLTSVLNKGNYKESLVGLFNYMEDGIVPRKAINTYNNINTLKIYSDLYGKSKK